MDRMDFVLPVLLGLLFMLPLPLRGQTIWELGNVPIGIPCTKVGNPALGALLGMEDAWVLNSHCITYNGTVGCNGVCGCSQGRDAYFNYTLNVCLGKVGAYCSAERSKFFPDKLCTPNADCVPCREGDPIGKCACRYGFKEGSLGGCTLNEDVNPGDQSTPRTTTTTTAQPSRPPFQLPPLSMFFKNNVLFNTSCGRAGILNGTTCNNHIYSVSCLGDEDNELVNRRCQCNMRDDSIFDAKLDMCVSRVGVWCLGREYLLGVKPCTANAECELEDGTSLEDGYSFGVCKCVYGFQESNIGTCIRNETISNPSTPKPIMGPSTSTLGTSTPKGPSGDGNGADGIYSMGGCLMLTTILFLNANYYVNQIFL